MLHKNAVDRNETFVIGGVVPLSGAYALLGTSMQKGVDLAIKDGEFVDQVYRNLFGRAADSSGMAHWTERLSAGKSRGWVMRQLCESSEYQRKTRSQVRVIAVYLGMLGRVPDSSGYNYWTLKDASSGTGLQAMIKQIRSSASYAGRVAP